MFLERCAKICFTKIRPILFFSSLLFPILLVTTYLFFQQRELQDLESSFSSTMKKAKITLEKKRKKERFLNRYAASNPYFISEKIESLHFLDQEKEDLKILLDHPAISNKKIFKERLAFLSGEENRLAFAEENIRRSSKIKETEEKQRHPVQIDEKDLQTILALIEDVSIDPLAAPQLIIRNFQLKKKETSLQTQVFEVEMALLKREWIQ